MGVFYSFFKLIVVWVMITQLIWTTGTPMSAVQRRLLNFITHLLLALCEENPSVTTGYPSQRVSIASLSGFFCDLHLNKRLNKQWICRWFGTQWRSCDVCVMVIFSNVAPSMANVVFPFKFIETCSHWFNYQRGNIVPGNGSMWPLLLTWFNFNPSMDK